MVFPLLDGGSQTPTPAPTPLSGSGGSASNYLNAFAAQQGIDLNAPGGGTTAYSAADQRTFADPYIYMGEHKITKKTNANVAESILASGGSVQGSTLTDLQAQFLQQKQDYQRHWAYLLALTGYAGSDVASDPTKAAAWAKNAPQQDVLAAHKAFLQDAAEQFNLYRRKITPNGLMKEMLQYRLGTNFDGNINSLDPSKAAALAAGTGLAGTHTSTQKTLDFMSPTDAKGLVRGMLQQQLGRDPTQAEYEDFIATIHAAEAANPSTSTTTYTTDSQGNTTNSSTKTSGGLSQSGLDQTLYQKARSLPSWAVWQAVGTYAPALFQALDAPVSGV